MKHLASAFTLVSTLILTITSAHAYDPVADFSITSNQNVAGVWGYGQTNVRGGTFSLLQTAVASSPFNGNLEGWQGNTPGFGANYPTINHNKTAVTQSYLTVTHPADELLLHPGPGGQNAVLRFIAPTTGVYRFQGTFTGRDTGPATTDVAILLNSTTTLFSGGININGLGNSTSFDIAQAFAAGDRIDFSVGYGNGFYGNDSTGLKFGATAAAAPEPSSAALLLGASLLPLGTLARRRTRGTL